MESTTRKQEEILEGNKLIAEFMGYYFFTGKFYSKDGGKGRWFKEAKYHTSWDALMEVVEKIGIMYDRGEINPSRHELSGLTIFNPIEKVWQAVVEFIKNIPEEYTTYINSQKLKA